MHKEQRCVCRDGEEGGLTPRVWVWCAVTMTVTVTVSRSVTATPGLPSCVRAGCDWGLRPRKASVVRARLCRAGAGQAGAPSRCQRTPPVSLHTSLLVPPPCVPLPRSSASLPSLALHRPPPALRLRALSATSSAGPEYRRGEGRGADLRLKRQCPLQGVRRWALARRWRRECSGGGKEQRKQKRPKRVG